MKLRPWRLPLRGWQREAISAWAMARPRNVLWNVTPGGGKTIPSIAVGHALLEAGDIDLMIVGVPGEHLRGQYADVGASQGVDLDPWFNNSDRTPARDVHGVVVTYQQIAADPMVFERLVHRRRSLVVMDEIHHCGANGTWGRSVERAFGQARYIIGLTGTPFRTDEHAISFVNYDTQGRCIPDYAYSYLDGLRDGVVRPLSFYEQGGVAEWERRDAEQRVIDSGNAAFGDDVEDRAAPDLLRSVLSSEEWLEATIARADAVLQALGGRNGSLAVTIDEAHARVVGRIIERVTGTPPVVVVSADSSAVSRIRRFARSDERWLVAVRMCSEGTDIQRLRVPVYLTTTCTELFVRQITGRIVRTGRAPGQGYVFYPGDQRLRAYMLGIAAEVAGWKRERAESRERKQRETPPAEEARFTVLAAEHSEGDVHSIGDVAVGEERPASGEDVDDGVLERKRAMRKAVFRLSGTMHRRFGVSYRQIHAYFLRRDHVPIARATLQQLESRETMMRDWLRQGRHPL